MLDHRKMYRKGVEAGIFKKRTFHENSKMLLFTLAAFISIQYVFNVDLKKWEFAMKLIFTLSFTAWLYYHVLLYRRGAQAGIFERRRKMPVLLIFFVMLLFLILIPLYPFLVN